MVDVNLETVTVTRKTRRVRLSAYDICDLLNREFERQGNATRVNTDPRVFFHVPGGGDWSNEDVDIDSEHPVVVEWTEVSEEGERDK